MSEPGQWPRIEELYYDALDLPATERAAFLARACGDDDGVRREVESLLAARNEAGNFLELPFIGHSLSGEARQARLTANLGHFIGQYQLLSVLGVGGMGEVFLAEDTRLHRQVALKLLPPQFSQQPGRVRRFEQEARATTALNHPNIVTLYDTGQHEGSYFIVNEFVDGQTLREHLNEHGPLPVNEALNIAQQIATALAAAHAAGIVHRDIKPENVMLRRDGFVKVLDFGLAKLTSAVPEPQVEQDDTQDEETPQAAILNPQSQTAAGALLGTIRYMSPEQARGGSVDARTDIFSLGVVLYEMLTGRTPFQRETATETLAAILEAELPSLPESIPMPLRRLTAQALRKDRTQRCQSSEEMTTALRRLVHEVQFNTQLPASEGERIWLHRWPVWAIVAALLVAGYFWWQPRDDFETAIRPYLKYRTLDSWKTEPTYAGSVLSTSPDGNFLTFIKTYHGQSDIFLKPMSDDASRNLTNDRWYDYGPIWSPDGREIAYVSERQNQYQVWAVSVADGTQRQLGTLALKPAWLTRWSRTVAGIYYEGNGNLYMLALATGESRQLTQFPSKAADFEFAISHDEQWLAYAQTANTVRQIFVRPLLGGTPRQITHEGENNGTPQWLPDGNRLLYRSKRNGVQQICLAFLDGRAPIQITSGHEQMVPWDVAPDGHSIFYFAEKEPEADVYLLSLRTSAERQLTGALSVELFPAFAPDGQHFVYQQANSRGVFYQQSLLRLTLTGGEPARVNESGAYPQWSPRGDRIAFLRQQGDLYQLWTVRPDGSEAQPLIQTGISFRGYQSAVYGWVSPPNFSWFPDGSRLTYAALQAGVSNIMSRAIDGTAETRLTNNTDTKLRFYSPIWSRDGKQLVFLGRHAVPGKTQFSVYRYDGRQAHLLWQTGEEVRLLGWSAKEDNFYVAAIKAGSELGPLNVKLLRLALTISPDQPHPIELPPLENAYWQTFTLSPNANQLAYVAREDDAANIWVASLINGQRRRLTANIDPALSLGSLTWTPQGDAIGFTKQSNTTSIGVIENFQ